MPMIIKPGEDIWRARADHMVVPVNTRSVMGAGMALTLKCLHPRAATSHRLWCQEGRYGGDILCSHYRSQGGAQVVLMATKEDWRGWARLTWVEKGLGLLHEVMAPGQTVALPLLGCGRGRLKPDAVMEVIRQRFSKSDRMAIVYPDHVPMVGQATVLSGSQA